MYKDLTIFVVVYLQKQKKNFFNHLALTTNTKKNFFSFNFFIYNHN
jgi:hypothetical protein